MIAWAESTQYNESVGRSGARRFFGSSVVEGGAFGADPLLRFFTINTIEGRL